MVTVGLTDLRIVAKHGFYEEERRAGEGGELLSQLAGRAWKRIRERAAIESSIPRGSLATAGAAERN